MTNHIKQIAKLLTEDPDVFNEITGTGAIAFGPSGNVSVIKKKKRKIPNEDDGALDLPKIKKYYADPVTGQPKVRGNKKDTSGEILYSDIDEPEKPIKEDSEEDQALIKLTKLLKPSSSPKGAFDALQGIKHTLKQLKYGSNCALIRNWNECIGSVQPSNKQSFWESTAQYLIRANQILDEHAVRCDSTECSQKKHTLYMIKAFCEGEELNLKEIWDQHKNDTSL